MSGSPPSKKRKAPEADNINNDFCEFLMELADFEKNVNRNMHKYKVYRSAAAVLADHPVRIKSGDEAKKLKGIGVKIGEKIDEFIKTGKLKKLERIRVDSVSIAISQLTRITGIGPAKARDLVESGISSIEELTEHKEKLTAQQLIGLNHYQDFEKRIPREEIKKMETLLKSELLTVDSEFELTICGSYRRGASDSGDIDGLLTHSSFASTKEAKENLLKKVVTSLQKEGFVTDVLSLGKNKFMGVCRLEETLPFRRIDLRLIHKDQYYCGILYFTGSDIFNKNMRVHALEKGFTLNEYSLRPVGSTGTAGEPLPIESERDIFDYLEYTYKEPKDRTS